MLYTPCANDPAHLVLGDIYKNNPQHYHQLLAENIALLENDPDCSDGESDED